MTENFCTMPNTIIITSNTLNSSDMKSYNLTEDYCTFSRLSENVERNAKYLGAFFNV